MDFQTQVTAAGATAKLAADALLLVIVGGSARALVGVVTGARAALGLLTMPIGLVFTAAFYISLWPSFTDSFGDPEATIAP